MKNKKKLTKQERKQRAKESNARWYAKNKIVARKKNKIYRDAHKEEIKKRARKYFKLNQSKIQKRHNCWVRKNRKKLNEKSRKWYNEHKDVKYQQRRTPSNRHTMAINTAKSRGYAFNISLKQYTLLIQQPCYYCGISLLNFAGICLDRIDDRYGYSLKNVLPACGPCNTSRNTHYTVEEFKIMMQALLKYRRSKGL